MFNTKLAGLVVGALFLGAGVAQAFPGSADDAGIRLPAQGTYAAAHGTMAGEAPAAAFAGIADDAGIRLPSRSTHADRHRERVMESLRAEGRPALPAGVWAD